jgi:16S rRNA (uracil1498-N3)-methyltransferase
MKQSLKTFIPAINPLADFSSFLKGPLPSSRFIAFVDASNPDHLKNMAKPGQDYLILIGPEGDFSPDELNSALQTGFIKVSLGQSRLRTETAALAACHILNLVNE